MQGDDVANIRLLNNSHNFFGASASTCFAIAYVGDPSISLLNGFAASLTFGACLIFLFDLWWFVRSLDFQFIH
jgi:hypothetical protein